MEFRPRAEVNVYVFRVQRSLGELLRKEKSCIAAVIEAGGCVPARPESLALESGTTWVLGPN